MELYQELLDFHSPGNRYVYYPPTKGWKSSLTETKSLITKDNTDPVVLYFHIPFCQQMCTFCGCNINLSKKESDHLEYVEALEIEWTLKNQKYGFEEELQTKDLYLTFGGGTPTDLMPSALKRLLGFIQEKVGGKVRFGLTEANPKTLNEEFISQVTSLGFKSFSFGVQDFSFEVCSNVNRHQSIEDIERAFQLLGEAHQKGIDLIWGLPKQSSQTIKEFWEAPLKRLKPDWVSFYPLAEVPWMKTYQEAYGDFRLPSLEEKYKIYQAGVQLLEENGFEHFGFGHFINRNSLPFWEGHYPYRIVSGLIPKRPQALLGFGVGSLTLGHNEYHQNEKVIEKYKAYLLKKNELPLISRYEVQERDQKFLLTRDELLYRGELPEVMKEDIFGDFPKNWFKNDQITLHGRHFLKNILQSLEKKHYVP